ncbi:hypothetical protein HCY66_06355 [Acinetobacter radioresistens]|uniref:hypothetical protein n=1 Tax=Acinetobacter radioresistens TaxID=40216 RepID=UPI0020056666|nr:hypothetical protein [Acinetobacter radioresistens]MCK4089707.1 hypothetical protein [Acinetobacter radioresistens]
MGKILITYHSLELDIVAISPHQPIPLVSHVSILDVFEKLKYWGYETRPRLFGGENRFCGLLPVIEIDKINNCVKMLLTLSDKDEDFQMARNFETGAVRSLDRDLEEGADKRVHVVVKIDPKNKFNAKFGIEHKQGVTTNLLIDTLNYLMRACKADKDTGSDQYFIGKHPTENYTVGENAGHPKPLGFKIKFSHMSELSNEIIQAFATGKIKSIEFYENDKAPNTFDPTGVFARKRSKVELNVTGQLIKSTSKKSSQKMADFKNGFKGLFAAHPDLKGLKFTINFTDSKKNHQSAYYDSQIEELIWAKKKYLDEKLRQRMTHIPTLNQDLCDRILANIT